MRLLHFLFFPGVALHEFSHYLACSLTGTRVFDARFYGEDAHVRHEKPGLLSSLIITVAPFFVSNFLGFLLLNLANSLSQADFPLSMVLYWIGISAVYFSFPSDADAMNSFHAFTSFFRKKIFHGKIIERLAWLILMPFIFIPIAAALSIILFFNYIVLLRILWLVFVFAAAM